MPHKTRHTAIALSLTLLMALALLLVSSGTAFGQDPEAKLAVDRATRAMEWVPPLEGRVTLLRNLLFFTIALTIITTILGTAKGKNFKYAVLVAGALAAAVASLRQYYEAPEDGAGAIRTDILDFKDSVDTHFSNFDVASQRLKDVPSPIPPDQKAEWAENIAEWQKSRAEDLAQLKRLNQTGGKLITRARALLNISAPPKSAALGFGTTVYAQSRASQTYRPSWVSRPTPDEDYFQAVGEALCAPSGAAREYAKYDARRKLALQLDPSAKDERLDAILAAIDDAVDDSRNHAEPGPVIAFSSVIQRAAPSSTRQFWLARLFKGTGISKVKAISKPAARPKAGWTAEGILRDGASGVSGGDGNGPTFNFTFNTVRGNAEIRTIEIVSDGSVGSTRWSFDVFVEGKRVLSIPVHRLDDGGKPSVCQPQPNEGLVFPVGRLPAKIRIVGFRGSDM